MINNVIIVGRTTDEAKITTLDSGVRVAHLTVACTRPFKNMDGTYDTDFIPVSLWAFNAQAAGKVRKGSTIGVMGRIVSSTRDVNGVKVKTLEVNGDRLTFINLKSEKDAANDAEPLPESKDEDTAEE